MSNATPEQIAKNAEAAKIAKEKREAEYKMFRENPAKLAEAIAWQIRYDEHAGEDPEDYENGKMHWWQSSWGYVRAKSGAFNKLTLPLKSRYEGRLLSPNQHDWFEVSCPTTGCVAGWADSLAGYSLLFQKSIHPEDEAEAREYNPKATLEDIVLDRYDENELINVEDCYDPIRQEARPIQDAARELLDLQGGESDYLFSGDRTKDEVLFVLDAIAEGNTEWFTEVEDRYSCDCCGHDGDDD